MNATGSKSDTAGKCPRCGAVLTADLCPRCLLAAAAEPASGPSGTAGAEAPALAAVAAAFPQFEILEFLGRGGMGCVYRARQPHLDRMVALKLLPQSLATDPAFVERFTREARVLARLSHPNIVNVYDFGQSGGFCYLVMEYVEGANLRQALRTGGFTAAQALAIIPRICEALQYAHGEGVLHRDIKPENILLDTRGRVKLVDFGVAKLVGDARADFTLTATGAPLGTPHYMAPEQVESPAEVDHRADIYSVGVVFYEMLTGGLPLGRFPAPSTKTPVDPRVDLVVFQALEKEKERRQQSADEVRTQVEGISSSPGIAANTADASTKAAAVSTLTSPLPTSWWDWAGPISAALGIWSTLGVLAGIWIVFRGDFSQAEFFAILASTATPGVAALVLGGLVLRRERERRVDSTARWWARWGVWTWPSAVGLILLGRVVGLNLSWFVPIVLLAGAIFFGRLLWRRTTTSDLRAYRPTVRLLGWLCLALLALHEIVRMVDSWHASRMQSRATKPAEVAVWPAITPPATINPSQSSFLAQPARGEQLYVSLQFQSNGLPVEPPLWNGLVIGKAPGQPVICEVSVEPSSVTGAKRIRFKYGEGETDLHEAWIQLPPEVNMLGISPLASLSLPPGYATNVWLFRSDAWAPGSEENSVPAWGIQAEIASGTRSINIRQGRTTWHYTNSASLSVRVGEVMKFIGLPPGSDAGRAEIHRRDGRREELTWSPGTAGSEDRTIVLRAGDVLELPENLGSLGTRTLAAPATVLLHGAIQRTVELIPGKTNLLTDVLLGINLGNQARLDRVILRRADGSQSTNDVQALLKDNNRAADVPLRDGDRIEIPVRTVLF